VEVSNELDCTSVNCPEPLLKTIAAADGLLVGDSLRVLVSSEAAREDIETWAVKSNHFVTSREDRGGKIVIAVRRTK
jgi:TusA-related sulfurtransferase